MKEHGVVWIPYRLYDCIMDACALFQSLATNRSLHPAFEECTDSTPGCGALENASHLPGHSDGYSRILIAVTLQVIVSLACRGYLDPAWNVFCNATLSTLSTL